MPMEQQKGFLERLQSLDESTKHKILIGATAVIMIVVVYFWLAYFNSIVVNLSAQPVAASGGAAQTGSTAQNAPAATTAAPAESATQSPTPAASGGGTSIWHNIGAGFMSLVHGFGNIFQSQGQYTVQPQQ